MDFHQKHEPKSFSMCAPTYDATSLMEYLESDNRKQVYLLHGSTGLGKTTTARILGNWLAGGKTVEVIEKNMADQNTIENVRDIVSAFRERTILADVRVFILDEPQRIQPKTQDVLIKALDELPEDIWVIFCTTDPQNLKDTLRHRTHEIAFKSLATKEQGELVKSIIEKEGFTIGGDTDTKNKIVSRDDAVEIIDNSQGSIRKLYDNIHTIITGGTLIPVEVEADTVSLVKAIHKGTWMDVNLAVRGTSSCELTRQQTCYAIVRLMSQAKDEKRLKQFGDALGCMIGLIVDPDPTNTLMFKAFGAWSHINGKSTWLK
jgi:DNA polymerase III delta prime subunit